MSQSVDYEAYASMFPSLGFEVPATGVLRVSMVGVGPASAMSAEMHSHLTDLWPMIDRDESVRAVVVRGGEDNFSAGGDFDFIESNINDITFRLQALKEVRDLVYNLVNCSTPIVAAITGHAMGAGLSIAMLSDVTIAGRSARIIDGHTRLGVPAGDHAVIVWPILCGLAKAKYYLLTCEEMTGEEAERIGLVSLCVDDHLVGERAVAVAERLASMSSFAVQWTKHTLNSWLRMAAPAFDASLALEFVGFGARDVVEGLASHREKRPPNFTDVAKRRPPETNTNTHASRSS